MQDHLRVMFRFLFSGICRVTHDSRLEGHSLLVVIGPVGRGKRGIAAFEPIESVGAKAIILHHVQSC
jgi:hypothetical protein